VWQSWATRKIIPRENFWPVCATRKMPRVRFSQLRFELVDHILPALPVARATQNRPFDATTHLRNASYSFAMLSITVDHAVHAIERLRLRS
jgi:hypothetical protein